MVVKLSVILVGYVMLSEVVGEGGGTGDEASMGLGMGGRPLMALRSEYGWFVLIDERALVGMLKRDG